MTALHGSNLGTVDTTLLKSLADWIDVFKGCGEQQSARSNDMTKLFETNF
jgi:hypothetical protein